MSKIETGKTENDHTARMLSGDELDAVSGGFSLGASNPYADVMVRGCCDGSHIADC